MFIFFLFNLSISVNSEESVDIWKKEIKKEDESTNIPTEDQANQNIKKIDNVPIIIIHGKDDITCIPESSCLLHKELPNSKLILVPDAGHLAGEPAITDALIDATDNMLNLI